MLASVEKAQKSAELPVPGIKFAGAGEYNSAKLDHEYDKRKLILIRKGDEFSFPILCRVNCLVSLIPEGIVLLSLLPGKSSSPSPSPCLTSLQVYLPVRVSGAQVLLNDNWEPQGRMIIIRTLPQPNMSSPFVAPVSVGHLSGHGNWLNIYTFRSYAAATA